MVRPAPLEDKMGVALYKDGAWSVFDENTFTDRLNEGWALTEGEVDIIHNDCGARIEDCQCENPEVSPVDDTEIILDNTLPKCSTAGYGIGSGPTAAEWLAYDKIAEITTPMLSNKKVRLAAKKAGFKHHAKARIETLRKALQL